MRDRLQLDSADLAQAARDTRAVLGCFSREGQHADAAANHVGHADLATEVRGFADSWDITRGRIAGHLSTLAAHLDATAETLADMDRQLESELRKAIS